MIKITVEVIPFGVEKWKKKVGEMTIANDGTGSGSRGNYKYNMSTKNRIWRKGRIEDFPRLSCSVWNLIYRVLRGVFKDGK